MTPMTDFALILKQAIERDVRDRFIAFLGSYQHVESGHRRALTIDEASIVLTCVDRFMADANLLDLGVAEIAGLRARLQDLANNTATTPSDFANTAFDALACITALEARLCRSVDRAEVRGRGVRLEPFQSCANDR